MRWFIKFSSWLRRSLTIDAAALDEVRERAALVQQAVRPPPGHLI